MNNRSSRTILIIGLVAILCIVNGCGSATPSEVNTTPLDPEQGYIISDVDKGEVIPAEDGVLRGVVPMSEFECSGRVYEFKKDKQDGFSYAVTLVFGQLAAPDIFEYLVADGSLNKQFDDGFVLTDRYFKSHIAAFYIRSATDNLEKAISDLEVGIPIRLKGAFVYLKTKNGLIKTSLNPAEFKCKYVYLSELSTEKSIYY